IQRDSGIHVGIPANGAHALGQLPQRLVEERPQVPQRNLACAPLAPLAFIGRAVAIRVGCLVERARLLLDLLAKRAWQRWTGVVEKFREVLVSWNGLHMRLLGAAAWPRRGTRSASSKLRTSIATRSAVRRGTIARAPWRSHSDSPLAATSRSAPMRSTR